MTLTVRRAGRLGQLRCRARSEAGAAGEIKALMRRTADIIRIGKRLLMTVAEVQISAYRFDRAP